MHWYEKLRSKCVGKGEWSACFQEIHGRRDATYALAETMANKMGHRLGKWHPMHINYCVRCGHNVACHNILAQTNSPDITGAALMVQCHVTMNNEKFVPDESLKEINKPAVNTVI